MCCRGLQGLAKSPHLNCFLFSGLLRVAPYYVPGGVRVVLRAEPAESGALLACRSLGALVTMWSSPSPALRRHGCTEERCARRIGTMRLLQKRTVLCVP